MNKREKFDYLREDAITSGLEIVTDDGLICPLCWKEVPYARLTEEHIVPENVGGHEWTLTCKGCNNTTGSTLDSHLKHFQDAIDGARGRSPLDITLDIEGHKLRAELILGSDCREFRVIDRASNPIAIEGSKKAWESGLVKSINFEINLKYRKNNFRTATVRAAYLAMFHRFGYEYAIDPDVRIMRERIANWRIDDPKLSTLTFEIREFSAPFDRQHIIVPAIFQDVRFFIVVIRLSCETVTHVGVVMPCPTPEGAGLFEKMEQWANDFAGFRLKIPANATFF